MKSKSVTFRPKTEHRVRLDKLAEATERSLTWLIEKAIEAHLPELEKKYAEDLARLEAGQKPKAEPSSKKAPGERFLQIVKKHYPPPK